jgi:hypothetical protein
MRRRRVGLAFSPTTQFDAGFALVLTWTENAFVQAASDTRRSAPIALREVVETTSPLPAPRVALPAFEHPHALLKLVDSCPQQRVLRL